MREKISTICEASSYRTYADMFGTFDFIINSKKESDVIVKILYFVTDLRIRWNTTLQVNINPDGKTAELEGFLVVDNQTAFSYDDVELGFAIFELPSSVPPSGSPALVQPSLTALRDEMLGDLNRLKSIKKTQRMRFL